MAAAKTGLGGGKVKYLLTLLMVDKAAAEVQLLVCIWTIFLQAQPETKKPSAMAGLSR